MKPTHVCTWPGGDTRAVVLIKGHADGVEIFWREEAPNGRYIPQNMVVPKDWLR